MYGGVSSQSIIFERNLKLVYFFSFRSSTVWWTARETTTTCLASTQGPAVTSWRWTRSRRWTPGSTWSVRPAASKRMSTNNLRPKIRSVKHPLQSQHLLRSLQSHCMRTRRWFRRQLRPRRPLNLAYLAHISTFPNVIQGNLPHLNVILSLNPDKLMAVSKNNLQK